MKTKTSKKHPAPKKAAPIRRTSAPTDPVAAARAAAFSDLDPARAFAHFRAAAEKVRIEGLVPFNGQPLVMRANISTALAAIQPHVATAAARMPEAPLREVFELPSLVMALDFAVGRVPVAKLSSGDIQAMLKEGAPWRELALSYLEVASHPLLDLVPVERVRAIRKGTGKLDAAQDFVAIRGLFAEFADALADKHPFPQDKLDELHTLGAALTQVLQPSGAVVVAPTRAAEAILRDQFAALVADRYDALEVLAAVALGRRKAAELLPALRSAAPVTSREPAVREPEPQPA